MLEGISAKFRALFQGFSRQGSLRASHIEDILRDIRIILLESDVALSVVKALITELEKHTQDILAALNPTATFKHHLHALITRHVSFGKSTFFSTAPPPCTIVMVGLQGAGKTSMCSKLAHYLTHKGRTVALVSVDTHRPAAQKQLHLWAESLQVTSLPPSQDTALDRAKQGKALAHTHDFLIIDTAGRYPTEAPMQKELTDLITLLEPQETWLTCDAFMGQGAQKVAESFHNVCPLTGLLFSRMDGNARGGALLSLSHDHALPIPLLGTGELPDQYQPFEPKDFASALLGEDDMKNLWHALEKDFSPKNTPAPTGAVTLNTLKHQWETLEKKGVGSLQSLLNKIPQGSKKGATLQDAQGKLKKSLAIVRAMTPQERLNPHILNASRKQRIARGSGVLVMHVNRMLKEFEAMKAMEKQLKKNPSATILMCGIVGYITLKHFPASPLPPMMQAIAHRGSDGQGMYQDKGVAFGHHRLAIFDPHPRSQQPFQTLDAVWMVNGAFYNYDALKKTYTTYPWTSHSDNEVLNPLMQDQGSRGIQNLQGMYALAWYDKPRHRVILARDRWGIKPLYYVMTADTFYFASQASALKCVVPSANILPHNRDALLHHRWISKETLYPHIHRFPAGEAWTIDTETLHIQRYCPTQFPSPLPGDTPRADPQYFHQNLTQTLDLHTQGDVPMGIFLSGGIDSQTLAWRSSSLPCFYATFEGSPPEIIRRHPHYGPLHRVHITPRLFWETLPLALHAMDDPFLDPAIVPSFLLARRAHAEGIKVILSGEGADEFLGGYRRYRRPYWRRWGQALHRKGLTFWPTLQNIHIQDQQAWLPGLLTKLDRLLMTWNIEGRTPFVDTYFSSYCQALPDRNKIRGRQGKWILRHHGAQHFLGPSNTWVWQKKKGFTYPIETWVTQNPNILPWLHRHPSIQTVNIPLFQTKGWLWRLTFYALWYDIHFASGPTLPPIA